MVGLETPRAVPQGRRGDSHAVAGRRPTFTGSGPALDQAGQAGSDMWSGAVAPTVLKRTDPD